MTHSIDTWLRLTAPPAAPLVADAAACDPQDVRAVARLRRAWPAALVAAALDLAAARRKARVKFPDVADTLVADAQGVEQATSRLVADHKALRFVECGGRALVVDLCCGIGGDAMGLAAAGLKVLAIDRDPASAWATRQNVRCHAAAADVTELGLNGLLHHVDPSRRAGGRRLWRYEDYQPGPTFIEQLIRRCPDGAVKLGPGIDLRASPKHAAGPRELEFISERGTLVQAVLWTGRLARGVRTATLLPQRQTVAGQPGLPPLGPAKRYLLQVNPALERAELIGELCRLLDVAAIHPDLGLLTADEPVDSPWLVAFELTASMPWRIGKLRTYLGQHNAGVVEVKTRGKAVDTDQAQAQLRGSGDARFTVFALRQGRKLTAMVTRRLDR